MNAREMWKMPLHDTVKAGPFEICRVPGGWIYSQGNWASSVFVPLNNEMVDREIEEEKEASRDKEAF